jgi:hypothetical protein
LRRIRSGKTREICKPAVFVASGSKSGVEKEIEAARMLFLGGGRAAIVRDGDSPDPGRTFPETKIGLGERRQSA